MAEFEDQKASLLKEIADLKSKVTGFTYWERNPVPLVLRTEELKVFGRADIQGKIKKRKTMKGMAGKVVQAVWQTDSLHCLSASQSGNVILWNAYTGNKDFLISTDSTRGGLMTIGLSSSDRFFATGGLDCMCSVFAVPTIETYDIDEQHPLCTFDRTSYVSGVAFAGDDTLLASGGDSKIVMYDVAKQTPKDTFTGHTGDVACVSLLGTSGNVFISGGIDKYVRVWDARAKNKLPVLNFPGHGGFVNCLDVLDPTGNPTTFVSGSDDCSCRLWDMRGTKQMNVYMNLNQESHSVNSVSFSSTGRLLFVGYASNYVTSWDTAYGDACEEMVGHTADIASVEISPDGKALLTSSWDGEISVWAA
jgi:guanine nucleotide-binding protein G(I)/G(S)/G(T) subunit beta-1